MKNSDKRKILGIDYGDYYIGLAIFDLSVDFIYPYKTLTREKENILRKIVRDIVDIVNKESITEIVVGLPLNMDGTEGDRVEKVKNFTHMLSNKLPDMKINYQDERLTTREASEILSARGVRKENQKDVLDQVAAEIILKDWKGGIENGRKEN